MTINNSLERTPSENRHKTEIIGASEYFSGLLVGGIGAAPLIIDELLSLEKYDIAQHGYISIETRSILAIMAVMGTGLVIDGARRVWSTLDLNKHEENRTL